MALDCLVWNVAECYKCEFMLLPLQSAAEGDYIACCMAVPCGLPQLGSCLQCFLQGWCHKCNCITVRIILMILYCLLPCQALGFSQPALQHRNGCLVFAVVLYFWQGLLHWPVVCVQPSGFVSFACWCHGLRVPYCTSKWTNIVVSYSSVAEVDRQVQWRTLRNPTLSILLIR